jgi:carboxyl-terminal processing protease
MKKRFNLLTVVVLALMAAGITFVITVTEVSNHYEAAYDAVLNSSDFGKLQEIRAYLDAYFVDDLDETALLDGAAEGLIEGTGDRWSYYVSAADYAEFEEQMNNAYVGIGVTIQWNEEEDGFEIMSVTEGGPAEESGIQVGDILVAVEGQSTADLDLDGTKNLVRGEEGTDVQLTFRRNGETLDLTVTRRSIDTVVVSYELLDSGDGLVTIENFDTNCSARAIEAIEALIDQGAQSIIFDVRNNPGGMKQELVTLLDYLLPEGVLFRSIDYQGNESVDTSDASYLDMPMAVLINENTYSAAEFLAAALQEYGAAVIVGTPTSGKGHYQNTFRLSDGSSINISTGEYFTPNGVSLDGVGVTPDVEVELDEADYYALYYDQLARNDDEQLLAAVAAVANLR